jgi:hypothetical protein
VASDLEAKVLERVNRLPQRDLIPNERAHEWVRTVVRRFPEQAEWHAIRAGGIGGSEIGELVQNFMGYRGDFSSAHEIVASKLLMRVPEESTPAMLRGQQTEELHRQWFYQKMGCARDNESFAKLTTGVGPRPWMRYSPDDVVRPLDGRPMRILIDYKAPSTMDEKDEERIAFQYNCQLAQGAMVAMHSGVALSGAYLSRLDWARWDLTINPAPIDERLFEVIDHAGNHYWDEFVMRGLVPDYVKRPRLNLVPDDQDKLERMSVTYARINTLAGELKKRADDVKGSMRNLLSRYDTSGSSVRTPFMSISTSETLTSEPDPAEALTDEQREAAELSLYDRRKMARYLSFRGVDLKPLVDLKLALARLKELGQDLKPLCNDEKLLKQLKNLKVDVDEHFRTAPGELDVERTKQALAESGLDVGAFLDFSYRFTVNGEFAEQLKPWIADVEAYLFPEILPAQSEEAVPEAELAFAGDERTATPRP